MVEFLAETNGRVVGFLIFFWGPKFPEIFRDFFFAQYLWGEILTMALATENPGCGGWIRFLR